MSTTSAIDRILHKARQELLDLSARNRLISTPRDSSRSKRLEIVDERSEHVFRLLFAQGKSLSFLPARGERDQEETDSGPSSSFSQPGDDAVLSDRAEERHVDTRLQTRLDSDQLQKRLLDLYSDAQTFEEEQGVSILYLALGFLKWYESPSSDRARYAPLILLPVELDRPSAGARFKLTARDEDIVTNLSLQAKLNNEFQIALPDVPDIEDLSPDKYFDDVAKAVAIQPRWAVLHNDIVLWFFSFAKYLMYRDLDPETWPKHAPLTANPLLRALLQDGFGSEPPICGENDHIDDLILPEQMVHVADADSSQTLVIEEVRRGRNLVVQGPPGTGKSQTITNMIAAAVKEGKRVLFVAEKMAALEVVKGRLDRLGLGALCLELHSHNANKKAVVEELSRTLNLGRPKFAGSAETAESLRHVRDRLNRHSRSMNSPLQHASITPYQIIGHLLSLYGKGADPVDFVVPDAQEWSRQRFGETCGLLRDIQTHVKEIGVPLEHAWRGVGLTSPPLPTDIRSLKSAFCQMQESLEEIVTAAKTLSKALRVQAQESIHLSAVEVLVRIATRVIDAPPMDRRQFENPVWENQRKAIAELVGYGHAMVACRTRLENVVADIAWDTDLSTVRQQIAAYGRSWMRWFRRGYRDAVARLQGVMQTDLPASTVERLEVIDNVIRGQAAIRAIDASDQIGRAAFGALWLGRNSNWPDLAAIVAWDKACLEERLPKSYRRVVARLENAKACREPLAVLVKRLQQLKQAFPEIARKLELDFVEAFGSDPFNHVPLATMIERVQLWQSQMESLSKWVAYSIRRKRLASCGLAGLAERLHSGRISGDSGEIQFQVAYYESLIKHVFESESDLAAFDGKTFDHWIQEFRELDQRRIEMAKVEVALAHYERVPRSNGVGEVATIRREIEKKRKLKPIRVLLREAGTAVQAIKPVFMMSPISVAQFLEPGSLEFDVLLIDEASQVSPVDAFGAIARSRQVVVVGDSKQLPPTRFFTKMLDDDSAPGDEEAFDAGDLESVLGLCVAQGVLQRMLRWHYRSRHHSLIEVSNREFYDNNLYVVPSPDHVTKENGLHFRAVPEGVFDRGGTATNRIEAKAVAQAVVEHARKFPKQSLGVGAFSVAQRDAIRDELELLLRTERGLDEFFARGRSEPFFIKNLENIQGDERDVIFISVGYGRDSSGFMAMNFGPLSSDGGERRLNVLISRARDRCEVFSSITADDIDLNRGRSRGTAAFKAFLGYAETGILDSRVPLGREYDSEFERQVAEALMGLGFDVHCQVGTSGFIIDLAVVDSDCPGRYLLGIECDGATYHSSRSARDRDRLREQVLRDRGWLIHRIWSTDWFHRPQEQLRKVLAAIENAKCSVTSRNQKGSAPLRTGTVADLEEIVRDTDPVEETSGDAPDWSVPYVEADIAVPSSSPVHMIPVPRLLDVVESIVKIESPIHREEIARRVTSLWGQQRTGRRISEAVSNAIEAGLRTRKFECSNEFVSTAGQTEVRVRNREAVSALTLRKPEMLPPQEVRAAVVRLIAEHIGIRREEVRCCVAKLLGFKSTSAQIKALIDLEIDRQIADGSATERDGKLFFAESN